jgi:S1-C subfamily serine protease
MNRPLSDKKESIASFSTRPARVPKISRPGLLPAKLRLTSMAFLLLLVGAVGFAGGLLGSKVENNSPRVATSTAAKQQYISNEGELISSIAKDVGQSVVSVNTTTQVTTPDIFGFGQTQSQQAAGTGFIISSDGIIVTNRHVVPAGTTSVSVTLADGTSYDNVQVIGRTSEANSLDVAFLKIGDLKGKDITPVTLGNSSKMQVGDRVVAIGNALGQFQNTVTSGIISGYGRDVTAGDQSGSSAENLTDLFQTDAAINEGNSGGPLVNINGEVIGMNTAVAGNAQNIGFAIPVNDIKGLISSVLNNGKLQQPYLGVRYVSLTNDLADEFNLKVSRGAYVTSGNGEPAVVPGSPAEKAGLKDGDVITKINSINIDNKTSLTSALSQFKVGDKVTLTVLHKGKTISLPTTIGNAPTS